MHVGILAAGFFALFRTGLLPRRITLAATILLTIAYACLTDLQPPVVRAAIIVIIACLALWNGRAALGFNTLAAAGIVVLMLNPASLFQAGPQLSFLAVATMIVFQPWLMPQPILDPLDRLIATTRPWPMRLGRSVRDVLWRTWLTGALIWVTSTPLVWKQYNLISPVALILNFVMILPVSLAMYSGFGTLIFGPFTSWVGRWLGAGCDESLRILEHSIAWFRGWPGAYFWLAAPPAWWIGIFYVVLAIVVVFPALRPRRHWLAAMTAVWIAGAFLLSGSGNSIPLRPWAAAPTTPAPTTATRPLACSFVAVGHGISVLVELPDGRNLLYDAGRLGSPQTGVRPISSVLWSRGISHLDAVVVSHADSDHFNALPELLNRFSVGAVYVSPIMFEREPPAVKELHESIVRHKIPIREVSGGTRLDAGGVKLEVLHPPRKGIIGSDNANSIVLLVEYAGRRVLLTGDLESPGLDDVLAEEPLDCDVVLAPHHGSPRSHPSGTVPAEQHKWLNASQPPYDSGMNEFIALRARARNRLDKLIAEARSEYEYQLVQIAKLEQDLLGKVSSRYKKISAAIESVIPSDRTFTTVDIMTALEALDSRRAWRKRSVDSHLSRLRERGLIRRIKRHTMNAPALYARGDANVDGPPLGDMTLLQVIRQVLVRPMTATEVVVACLEAGYETEMSSTHLRLHVKRLLKRGGFTSAGGKWNC